MSSNINVKRRGSGNPTNSAYADTIADYENVAVALGDNTIENVDCDASVFVGAVIRMNGSTAVNAIANSEPNSQVIGICTSKPTGTTCNILTCGFTGSIFAGLSTGSVYYLSDVTLGQITQTPPTTSGSYVIKIGKTQSGTNMIFQYERIVKRS